MAIDKQVAGGLSPEQITAAVGLGAQMRDAPMNAAYKQAVVDQMTGGLSLDQQKLKVQQQQFAQQHSLAQQRATLDAQEFGLKQQLAGLEERRLNSQAPLTAAEAKLKGELVTQLQRVSELKGVIDVQGNMVPLNVLGADNIARIGVAGMVQEQKEDPKMAYERIYKSSLGSSFSGDKQAEAVAHQRAYNYIMQVYGSEIASYFRTQGGAGAGAAPKKSNPFGW